MNIAMGVLLIGVILLAGTMDYAHELEIDALRKELIPQRVMAERLPPELRGCKDGWIVTYADAGPKLMRCL